MDNYFPLWALLLKLEELRMGAYSIGKVNTSAFSPQLHDNRKNIPWNEISGGQADVVSQVLADQ